MGRIKGWVRENMSFLHTFIQVSDVVVLKCNDF
jgi:hypothetical protein